MPGEGQFVLAGGVELPGVDVLLQKFLRQILDGEATGRASRARGHERAHPSLGLLEQSGGLRTRLRDRDRRIAAEIHPVLAAQEELPARLGPALAGHPDEQLAVPFVPTRTDSPGMAPFSSRRYSASNQ